jgi:hypothetical protein
VSKKKKKKKTTTTTKKKNQQEENRGAGNPPGLLGESLSAQDSTGLNMWADKQLRRRQQP